MLAQVYSAIPNDVITAARWNNEFGNIYNNGTSVAFPVTSSVSFAGFDLVLDSAGTTILSSSALQGFILNVASKAGLPSTIGKAFDVSPMTFTDTDTGVASTATVNNFSSFNTPTLAAQNTTVTTQSAATVYIAGAPTAGTNQTIQNSMALRVDGPIGGTGPAVVNELRLSLSTGVSVTTGAVSAAGTLYLVPHRGSHISLFNGSVWSILSTTEKSLALTATAAKPYDVFAYSNNGTVTLETLVWTNDTTRATALTTQNGVLVKSGDPTRRYLGTFYASNTNVTDDSQASRYLWNCYNRVERILRCTTEGTDSWTYTTATWQQANANAANQLDFVLGLQEDGVEATVAGFSSNSSANISRGVGIGLDSTSVNSAHNFGGHTNPLGAGAMAAHRADYSATVAVGKHSLVWLERSVATGTTTWRGDNGDVYMQAGIWGTVWA